MVSPERFRFEMGGEWDIDDLESLSAALRLSYAYFYWITVDPEVMEPRVRSMFSRYFWSGEYIGDRFAQDLYYHIPAEYRLRIASIHYSSPGWLEVLGAIGVIQALAFCARAWIHNAEKVFDLFTKINRYFEDRKLRRIEKLVSLDDIRPEFIDEARALCFEFGKVLGLDEKQAIQMIELTGNPISTLRLMVALSNESKRLIELQKAGKLKVPNQ